MSMFLTEEQELIRNSVREWCNDPKVKEAAAKDYQRAPGTLEENTWKLAAEQGYMGAWVPEEYGGMGYSMTDYLVILEELQRNGNPASGPMTCADLGMLPIMYWGTEEQKKAFLGPVCRGEATMMGSVTDPAGLGNFAEWGMKVTKDGDEYVLNGNKVCGTMIDIADYKVVFGPAENSDWSSSVYVVKKGQEGVETGFREEKIIPSLADWGSMNLKDVRVPEFNRVVDNGFGGKWMAPSYMFMGIMSLTVSEAAFNKTMEFCKQRTRYGRPLVAIQTVSHKLVDMAIKIANMRELVYTAAKLWDEGRYLEGARYASMVKIYATESCTEITQECTILHGGVGFTQAAGIGRMWISSVGIQIAEQPPAVHRDIVAKTFGIDEGWKNGGMNGAL